MNAVSVLKKHFGYEEFRPAQAEIINSILACRDCLALMPTGGGKSVCYQVPALILPGLTVVISPLIALMKDQVDALRLNGISAAFLNSSQSSTEQKSLIGEISQGKIKLLYIAPERLQSRQKNFFAFLKTMDVSLFAIDEAHCISHWGHDFRPDYLMLSQLRDSFPAVPIVALTATADKLTRIDIIQKLKLHKPYVSVSSFNRKNIRYIIEDKTDHFARIIEFLAQHKGESGIIYCLSRKNTEDMAERLQKCGYKALAYHAGLDSATRTERQEKFKHDEIPIIVATIAFGMGVDKSNVRFIIHATIPKNIEGYYQETGRAGRDNLPAQSLMFYSGADVRKLRAFVSVEGNAKQTAIYTKKLNQLASMCISNECRRKTILNYFDEQFEAPCGNCDVCLGATKNWNAFEGTIIAQKALSAVIRLENQFGMMYVINFLRGSDSKKIYERHRQLPTFGRGAEISLPHWKNYFSQLLDQGLLAKHGEYSVLHVTDKGKKVLYQNEKVTLIEPKTKRDQESQRNANYSQSDASQVYFKELFEELKLLRLEISKRENVPPYIVFADNALIELATFLPTTGNDLQYISGFGKVKIEKYGSEFLNAIRKFCSLRNINSRMNEKHVSTSAHHVRKTKSKNGSNTLKQTFELYCQGLPLKEIARKRQLAESTITNHLLHFVRLGQINVLKFVSKEKLHVISGMVDEHGSADLSKLKNHLGEKYSYTEIKAVIEYRNRIQDRS